MSEPDQPNPLTNAQQPPRRRHPLSARPRPPPTGNEEAGATLRLNEFDDVDTLTLSEAALVLNALQTKRRAEGREYMTDTLRQTLDYLDIFARFTQKENVEAAERLLSAVPQLSKFERAQLGSLLPPDHMEAKTLIPSLQDKISDEELQHLLDELSKLQEK